MYTILNRDFVYNNISAVYFTNPKFYDNRGYFTVGFNKEDFKNTINNNFEVIQHNISSSARNVARGLHFQSDHNQAKLVHCIDGSVIDIIVDMRINSPYFGKGKAYLLDNINTYLYVPRGFAHGFITTGTDDNIFEYFVDNIWDKSSECVLNFKDYMINNDIYLTNTKNEIRSLSSYLNVETDLNLKFSAKDFNIAKTYLEDDESINEFKELVKNNKDFNY